MVHILLHFKAKTPEEDAMTTISQKIQAWFSAVAFAEEGDSRTALELATHTPALPQHKSAFAESLSRIFTAAAFAEEGLHAEAQRIYSQAPVATASRSKGSFLDMVGLGSAPVCLVVAGPKPSFMEAVGLGSARACYVMAPS
jgi:hypothetical protein